MERLYKYVCGCRTAPGKSTKWNLARKVGRSAPRLLLSRHHRSSCHLLYYRAITPTWKMARPLQKVVTGNYDLRFSFSHNEWQEYNKKAELQQNGVV